ncbi:3-oxoacyl-ACP reductase FabG [Candidatus Alkanophaga liquidiphilum]|nr:NAD-dependent dehydrogenase [Candidatus Alkanophaga liquidiphilum]RLG38019.1 MAG: 3-oxoacyl-ACP reductase [Candidatus Alkanophagales archaeon]
MGRGIDGKVAVVTGAGRGIGKMDALLLAREGAKVCVSDIDADVAEAVAKEINDMGGEAMAYACDVTKFDQVKDMMKAVADKWGDRIQILVNNAGLTMDSLAHKMTDEEWDRVVNINLKGPFNCVRAIAPYMLKDEYKGSTTSCGKIVNVSSIAGAMGNIGQLNYSSAKAGLFGFTKTLAREWARYKINVNCVVYGAVATRLTDEKEKGVTVEGRPIGIPKKLRDMMAAQIPWGRFATPEEAARPVVFLCSDDAEYITGAILFVTGGVYM